MLELIMPHTHRHGGKLTGTDYCVWCVALCVNTWIAASPKRYARVSWDVPAYAVTANVVPSTSNSEATLYKHAAHPALSPTYAHSANPATNVGTGTT